MNRVVLSVALGLLVYQLAPQQASAQDERIEFRQKFGAPDNPGSGPTEPYVYRNNEGVFKLTPDGEGVARYIWGNRRHADSLRLIAYGEITDRTGIGVPPGQSYDIWLYEATDIQGNTWYLAFGVDPLVGRDVPPGRYGLYYSYKNPIEGGSLKRWLTWNGTRRQ
jgi:hypothetical protein